MRKQTKALCLLLAVALALTAVGSLMPLSGAIAAVNTPSCPSGCTRTGGSLRIDSASNVQVNSEVTLAINLENITDMYGLEIKLAFNPAILQVQDDKPGTVGMQIQPGEFPSPESYFIAQNAADNSAGTIAYAVSLLSPSPAASGSGVVARIRFKALAAGTSNVSITQLAIVAKDNCCLIPTMTDGVVTVVGAQAGGTVTGRVLVQGRSNYSGVTVTVGGRQGATGTDGSFTISSVPAGTYTASAVIANYLRADKSGVIVTNGGTATLADVTLLAGDVDNNCTINIFDLVPLGAAYSSSPPSDARVDFNQDNVINIFDLVLLAGNYSKSCPGPW
jgi:hypothetical protein